MGKEQESEWNAAQSIIITQDLVTAAKRHLQFLAAVDKNRWLYQGQALQRAIYRYNACWLPLLAKHSKSWVTQGPLVVPLDCEWVWHCHRLNPVRYKSDCEEFYGRILDNYHVASSVEGTSTMETQGIWNKLYPSEPYIIESTFSNEFLEKIHNAENHTTYNLVLAVERQSSFYYQVSRPLVNNDRFLEAAVARYKGFLHLIKTNKEQSIRLFCVPTYDIDLIWHTHQLDPASYCKDLVKLLGKILEHDDTDQDRGKGQKLDVGFSQTTKQWEEKFGSGYWRAGAMYRGTAPSPLTATPFIPDLVAKKVDSTNGFQRLIHLPKVNVTEVVLEFVEAKNLPETHKGRVGVSFSKAKPDGIFNVKRKLNIQSESGKKQVATFQCQPTGHLLFELVSDSPSNLSSSEPVKTLGYCFFSLEDFLLEASNLSVEKWLDLIPSPGIISSEPIRLRVATSCTVPFPAPHVFQIARNAPFSQLPDKVQFSNSWTQVTDETGNEILSLQMREMKTTKGTDDKSRKELIGITKTGETLVFGQFLGSEWSMMDSLWSLQLQNTNDRDAHLLLTGPRTVKLVPGRRLDYELNQHDKRTQKHKFMTAVEFSGEHPYGRAIALIDINSGLVTLEESWLVLPGILSAFIVCNILGYGGENVEEEFTAEEVGFDAKVKMVIPESGGCGGGCGSECGSMMKGGGCGNMVKSGGCGGGCGAGCGGGCGGCGGGCGNMVRSGNDAEPMQVAA